MKRPQSARWPNLLLGPLEGQRHTNAYPDNRFYSTKCDIQLSFSDFSARNSVQGLNLACWRGTKRQTPPLGGVALNSPCLAAVGSGRCDSHRMPGTKSVHILLTSRKPVQLDRQCSVMLSAETGQSHTNRYRGLCLTTSSHACKGSWTTTHPHQGVPEGKVGNLWQ